MGAVLLRTMLYTRPVKLACKWMLFTTRSNCRKQTGRHFLFHNFVSFCRKTTFSQLNIECFIYFLALTIIYTTFCTVQQIYYTQPNGKASSSLFCSVLFVQKYHAYTACNWLNIVNIVEKSKLQKVTRKWALVGFEATLHGSYCKHSNHSVIKDTCCACNFAPF